MPRKWAAGTGQGRQLGWMQRKGKELSELLEDPARGPAVAQPLPARMGSGAFLLGRSSSHWYTAELQ